MKIQLCIFFLLFGAYPLQGVEPEQSPSIVRFEDLLGRLNKLEQENFLEDVENVKNLFDKYFSNKSRVCQGEFTTMVLGVEEQESNEKLSQSEIKACLTKLANERMVYIDAIYEKRKKYLVYLHQKQIEQLNKTKEFEVAKWQKLKTAK